MIKERLKAFRALMTDNGIDLYIIPTSDFHDSEYVGEYFRAREFMSGFTGSAGTLLITMTSAYLWTDGRYFLQAAQQLENSTIELMKSGEPGVPSISGFLKANISEGMVLGFDGRVVSVNEGLEYSEICKANNAGICFDKDLVNILWNDRPAMSENKVFILDDNLTGLNIKDKLAKVRRVMSDNSCTAHILTSLDDIAWLLNLRGSDVACNPVFLSNLVLFADKAVLFARENAFDNEVKDYLAAAGIELKPYGDFYVYLKTIADGTRILISRNKLNFSIYMLIHNSTELIDAANPSTLFKAIKNETEIANLRKANVNDGVAMVKFLYWLDNTIGKEKITEISASDKLEAFRAEQPGFKGISFDTISGYMAHGAIIHYEATPETDVEINPEGLLLVDSGAQYLYGTTDITRTIAVGPLTEEMKHHYTMVLRANLNLARIRFMKGCAGANLDILARAPFWEEGLNFNHGTGHGIGYFLNVHEGPQSFHYSLGRKSTSTPLEAGMVITDEPGIYIEGKYGIRIENDLLCREDITNEYGSFMSFEVLTLCPIDLRPVNTDELTAAEKKELNRYHAQVYSKLSPYLNADETEWLRKATKEI